jgi:hypothetical protein
MSSKNGRSSEYVDWHRLSTVEFASALEVYWIADRFGGQPEMQRIILEHALDEYRHADMFKGIAQKENHMQFNSINIHGLIEWGGISSQNIPLNDLIKTTVSFVLGEKRAEASLKNLVIRVTDPRYREMLQSVLQDERRHTLGVNHFLKKKSIWKVCFFTAVIEIFYRLKIIQNSTHLRYFRNLSFRFLIKFLMKFPTEKLARLPELTGRTLQESLKDARRMA